MKKCINCGQELDITQFRVRNSKTNTRYNVCKECAKIYGKKHYKKNKEKYLEKNTKHRKYLRAYINRYKQYCGCRVCGDKRFWVLDFHHIDPKEKDFTISLDINRFSIRTLKNELRKCEVLCANCHRDLHYKLTII